MKDTKHRSSLGRRVIHSALAVIVALAAVDTASIKVYASSTELLYKSYEEVLEESVIDITWDEYSDFLRMVMAESGHRGEELMNGCASVAVNRCIRNECTMQETLDYPGAFSFKFRDSEGKWRTVELSDVNDTVVDAANDALLGNDATAEIGGAIGFFAPESCSKKNRKNMYKHISGGETMQIENMVFYSEWK